MGLVLPQTVKVRVSKRMCKYYREKGYTFEKFTDFVEVDVIDLPKGSHKMVKVICDICGKESEMWYRDIVKCNEENKSITCGSNSCRNKKYEDTCIKKYGKGIINVFQAEEVKDKIKDTNLERYSCEYPMQNKEIQDKARDTCREKYGVDNPSKAQEIKDKKKNTCQSHFKCDWPFQNKEVREKSKQTWLKNYGVDNPFKFNMVQDKAKATWKNNYGEDITSPFQLESVREKSKQTWLKNYGVDYPFKSSIIQDKAKETWQENYGENIENPFQLESVKEKSKQTWLKNYGVDNPMKNEEIKNKALDSFQFNGTGPCSRAQRYVNYILNGTLNKRICGSLADIYMEKENIVIEHDGSGHFLGDIMNGNKIPTKESLLYEKEREDKIINNGYRMIRFIANKDRIPSDEVILNLIEGFKKSDFKVVRINFEEGVIEKDCEEKWYCDFGELRKITKEDLEKFEKQEENTSEN